MKALTLLFALAAAVYPQTSAQLLISQKIAAGGGGNLITRVQPATPGTTTQGVCSSGSAVTTINCSFSTTPTVGNTIVIWVGVTSSVTFNTPTDNQSGNTYTNIAGATNQTTESLGVWRSKVVGASGTFTITSTWTGSQFPTVLLMEYSGVATSPDDQANKAQSSGTAMSPGAITTTNANDLILGSCFNSGGATVTFTPAASFAIENQQTNSSSFFAGAAQDQIVTATGTYTASMTGSASGNWVCGVIGLKSN